MSLAHATTASAPSHAAPNAAPNVRQPILVVTDMSVRFGALVAVNSVNFVAQAGQITSVIGPNGAGKSTLFNLISGAIKPTSGTVLFNGNDVTGQSPSALMRAGLSRSFQITNLFFELSVYENLRLAAQALEPTRKSFLSVRHSMRARERAEQLIEQFHLNDKAHELAGYLSHGEQRRLEIAVALACQPRMLLLDEPTQGMSHGDTEEVGNMIKQLAGEISILLVEHDVGLVMNLSDHVVVLTQGAKLAEGPPAEVRANPAVQTAYFGHGA
jgi:branched-chain amino acid transport system ATP-binding protein